MGDVPAADLLNRWMSIRTGGDLLRGELAFALAKAVKIVRGLRQALTRDEHEAVADHVVRQIAAKPNDPWKLNEELAPPPASRWARILCRLAELFCEISAVRYQAA